MLSSNTTELKQFTSREVLDNSPVDNETMLPFSEPVSSLMEGNNLTRESARSSMEELSEQNNPLCFNLIGIPDTSQSFEDATVPEQINENYNAFLNIFKSQDEVHDYSQPMSVEKMNKLLISCPQGEDINVALANLNYLIIANQGHVVDEEAPVSVISGDVAGGNSFEYDHLGEDFMEVKVEDTEISVSTANNFAIDSLVKLGVQTQNYPMTNLGLNDIDNINFSDPDNLVIMQNKSQLHTPPLPSVDVVEENVVTPEKVKVIYNQYEFASSDNLFCDDDFTKYGSTVGMVKVDQEQKIKQEEMVSKKDDLLKENTPSEDIDKLKKLNVKATNDKPKMSMESKFKIFEAREKTKNSVVNTKINANEIGFPIRRNSKTPVSAPKKKQKSLPTNISDVSGNPSISSVVLPSYPGKETTLGTDIDVNTKVNSDIKVVGKCIKSEDACKWNINPFPSSTNNVKFDKNQLGMKTDVQSKTNEFTNTINISSLLNKPLMNLSKNSDIELFDNKKSVRVERKIVDQNPEKKTRVDKIQDNRMDKSVDDNKLGSNPKAETRAKIEDITKVKLDNFLNNFSIGKISTKRRVDTVTLNTEAQTKCGAKVLNTNTVQCEALVRNFGTEDEKSFGNLNPNTRTFSKRSPKPIVDTIKAANSFLKVNEPAEPDLIYTDKYDAIKSRQRRPTNKLINDYTNGTLLRVEKEAQFIPEMDEVKKTASYKSISKMEEKDKKKRRLPYKDESSNDSSYAKRLKMNESITSERDKIKTKHIVVSEKLRREHNALDENVDFVVKHKKVKHSEPTSSEDSNTSFDKLYRQGNINKLLERKKTTGVNVDYKSGVKMKEERYITNPKLEKKLPAYHTNFESKFPQLRQHNSEKRPNEGSSRNYAQFQISSTSSIDRSARQMKIAQSVKNYTHSQAGTHYKVPESERHHYISKKRLPYSVDTYKDKRRESQMVDSSFSRQPHKSNDLNKNSDVKPQVKFSANSGTASTSTTSDSNKRLHSEPQGREPSISNR